jgi:septal ring factor EnvC (AmiA/AmiB activator)
MKSSLIILLFLLIGCSSKIEEEDSDEITIDQQSFTNIDKLINSNKEKQNQIFTVNKLIDSNVNEKIKVTTNVMTIMKEKVIELKEKNEVLKDKIDDVNSSVGKSYKLLPILSDSQNHR